MMADNARCVASAATRTINSSTTHAYRFSESSAADVVFRGRISELVESIESIVLNVNKFALWRLCSSAFFIACFDAICTEYVTEIVRHGNHNFTWQRHDASCGLTILLLYGSDVHDGRQLPPTNATRRSELNFRAHSG